MFSFVDVPHGEWPVVLPTNPKHALFLVPGKESVLSMKNSTHIRVLAFSTARLIGVRVRIDNGEWSDCQHVKGPLYVHPWNNSKFHKGVHQLIVRYFKYFKRILSVKYVRLKLKMN
jgi:hypothetical protein